ncbi:hypothetical protein Hdeb2414_s0986g00970951 [Helianthus debilis subsp. tardiflorus]
MHMKNQECSVCGPSRAWLLLKLKLIHLTIICQNKKSRTYFGTSRFGYSVFVLK